MASLVTYPRRGLHGEVVHSIGLRIVSGDILPGEPLPPEDELVGDLSVSRTVVREAVRVLAEKGLVEARPKTGTRVRPRSDWNIGDPDVLSWRLETSRDTTSCSPRPSRSDSRSSRSRPGLRRRGQPTRRSPGSRRRSRG